VASAGEPKARVELDDIRKHLGEGAARVDAPADCAG
jgi:hypothetical protein